MNMGDRCGGLGVHGDDGHTLGDPGCIARPVKMSNNATATFDESKVKLVFCAKMECDTKPYDCYCCWNERPESLCYDTMRECRAKCPHCDPVCPP
ncbi:hypothetical protein SETIT_9G516400v2 [Setaria italica]|uniref:Uncharacterized protein n=1 Tax=Setaria italica TaxID=4555 RepID=A0A368SUX3_SETIT|nr:hypothetical protein SETIT_9G516400v2 [Setaria italica]